MRVPAAFSVCVSALLAFLIGSSVALGDEITDEMAKSPNGQAQVIIAINPAQLAEPQESALTGLREVSKLLADEDKPNVHWIGKQPMLAGIIGKASYDRLANTPGVTLVADEPSAAVSSTARSLVGMEEEEGTVVPLVGATPGAGLSPQGRYAVAVIDSGFDVTHPFIKGSILRQACFSTAKYAVAKVKSLCPNGYEVQTAGDAASPCGILPLACEHGTHVAGLISGKGGVNGASKFDGISPGTPLILVTSFTEFLEPATCFSIGYSSAPCIGSFLSDQIEALEYVRLLSTEHFIAAINFSQGSPPKGKCSEHILGPVIQSLMDAGIPTVAAAGNNGKNVSLVPACIPVVVDVAASDQTGNFAAKYPSPLKGGSNWSEEVDIVAPGIALLSAGPNGGYIERTGTSMSVPLVVGTLSRIRQVIAPPAGIPGGAAAMAKMSVDLLTSEGVKVMIGVAADGKEIDRPRLDVIVTQQAALAYHKAQSDEIASPAGAAQQPDTQAKWGWAPDEPGTNRNILLSNKPFTNKQIIGLGELLVKSIGTSSFEVQPQSDPNRVIVDSAVPIDKKLLETLTKQMGKSVRAYDDAISTIP
ncbi:S8 family peptidase [Rhizobium leguminosarum]|uniref:S8 family peptidase n=1 Tax=Rhizobium leguminosarum TaxID=384 RepID=UPI0009B818E6|nr:S8 family serine peptidase [Rhizobium leguminosarum]